MKIIVCVDNQNGMMFNHRRQSQDRVLRKRIMELTGGKKLWMNAYSQKQFLQVNGNMPKEQEQSGQLGQSGQIQADAASANPDAIRKTVGSLFNLLASNGAWIPHLKMARCATIGTRWWAWRTRSTPTPPACETAC